MSNASLDLQVGDRVTFEGPDGVPWFGVIDAISRNEYHPDTPMATVIIDGGGIGVEGPLEGFDPESVTES